MRPEARQRDLPLRALAGVKRFPSWVRRGAKAVRLSGVVERADSLPSQLTGDSYHPRSPIGLHPLLIKLKKEGTFLASSLRDRNSSLAPTNVVTLLQSTKGKPMGEVNHLCEK